LGGGGPGKPDPNWAAPLLLEAFTDDYPIVRFFAANGLAARDGRAPKPDYLAATAAARQATIERWWTLFADKRQTVATIAAMLRTKRVNVDLEVGE
jgi:hypothetical protein